VALAFIKRTLAPPKLTLSRVDVTLEEALPITSSIGTSFFTLLKVIPFLGTAFSNE
jgi:hypothetical protein